LSNVLQFENRLVRSLRGEIQVPRPDALQPFHLASPAERCRRVRRVLLQAFLLWRAGGKTMVTAVREAADGRASGEYALIELRRVLLELDLIAWESHPARLRSDVRTLFRRTIGRLTPHRGGWHVNPPRVA
jgi:hypothetical protein